MPNDITLSSYINDSIALIGKNNVNMSHQKTLSLYNQERSSCFNR